MRTGSRGCWWGGVLVTLGLYGCDGQQAAKNAVEDTTRPTTTTQAAPVATTPGAAAPAAPSADEQRLHQSFAAATRSDPPEDFQRPPDRTMTNKSVGKVYTEVVNTWENIRFTNARGKRIFYTASLDTEMGTIEITLLPDVAPNHVRNFLALAQVGFYDGLVFQRTVHEKAEGHPDLELIEGGCPLGTGVVGQGSIGYWLKPEFNDETHVEGTVGACHGQDPASAACKFYVTLSKASYLDKQFTVFGKVTQGLDVARRIFALPVRNDPEYPEGDRPEKPVVIRKVTINTREVE